MGMLLLSLLSGFLIFFVPGFWVLQQLKAKLSVVIRVVLSIAVGYTLWGFQAYILGYIHLRPLSWLYVVLCLVALYLMRKRVFSFAKEVENSIRESDWVASVVIIVGVIVQVLQMIGTSLVSSDGMAFWRVHMQDGIYHLSLIQGMIRSFPPIEPGAAGIAVQNYHYWSDLIFADWARVFHLSVPFLFFQFSPWFFALFTGLAVWALTQLLFPGKVATRLALFFLFFGADAGYIAAFLIHHVPSFQYPVIDNGATQFLNMPHVAAKFVFFASMIAVYFWMKKKEWKWGGISILLTAVLFGLKIYFALYAVLALGIIGLVSLIQKRSVKLFVQLLVFGVLGGLVAMAIYLPPNHGAGGLLWLPLEWPKLILSQDNLDWMNWRYKLAVAQLIHSKAKIWFYSIEAILVTFLVIHGTRILGFFTAPKLAKRLGWGWSLYLIVPSLLFTILGLYTFQVSGGFNVFNFFAMSLSLLALLTAWSLAVWWEHWGVIGKVLVVIVMIVTLPRIVFETQKIITSYQQHIDVYDVSLGEMDVMNQADKLLPQGCVIATSPENERDMMTPYVSYFTNRFTYMSGENVLETHNQPTKERFDSYKQLFSSGDKNRIVSGLQADHVCALYLRQGDTSAVATFASVTPLYKNNEAELIDLR